MGKPPRVKRNSTPAKSPYQKPGAVSASKAAPIFKFNTTIGQHILKNGQIADAIVNKASLSPNDTVLEVGPGTGILTTRILDKAKKVVAVELDPRMAAELTCRVQGTPSEKRLQIVLGDFLKTDLGKFPPFTVCISNTPYQISSQLIFKILSMPNPPKMNVLMVQREFALRLIARPGDSLYSRLSVNVQFFARVSHVMKVSRNNFTPPPQVESSVVRIEPKTDRPAISWDEWDGMLRICFVRKNKTLRASWMQTKVRALIERNWLTWAGMNPDKVTEADTDVLLGKVVPEQMRDVDNLDDSIDQEMRDVDDDDNEDMFDDAAASNDVAAVIGTGKGDTRPVNIGAHQVPRNMVTRLILVKIQRILDQTKLSNARAMKCDENDFLRLLHTANLEGIHFS